MDFGSLQTVTAWRLSRPGATCQGVVVHGPEGFRLVVIENQQIVEWTRVPTAAALRAHVRASFKKRHQAGWRRHRNPVGLAITDGPTLPTRRRRSTDRHGLLRIAEQIGA